MGSLRLQVFVSQSGICSRRKALELIQAGRVTVNGQKKSEPSHPVREDGDLIAVDGKRITLQRKTYILLYKPKGVMATVRDRFAEKTVIELIGRAARGLYPVGRLDKATTGLLLCTNDGVLTHRLIHPSKKVKKVYHAILNKALSIKDRTRMEKGLVLEGRKTAPCCLRMRGGGIVEVTLTEGRKRQIRKMFIQMGYHVQELCRVKHGSLTLGTLLPGQWRFLSREEVKRLYQELSIST